MLEQTKFELENNMNRRIFAYTARATQVIAGCSNKISIYLNLYSVVKYSIAFVTFTHGSSSSGFVSNAIARWCGSHPRNITKRPVTQNFYAAVCDIGRRDGIRTSHTNGTLPLIRGTLYQLRSRKLIHRATLAIQYGPWSVF